MRISDWSSDVCSSDLRGSRKKATWRRLRSSQGHPLPAAVATAASPLQRRLQQPADESLRARCLRVVVGVRGFVHVDALAGFQLHRSEEHTSELQSLMRISYAVFCLKKKKNYYPSKTNDATK